MITYPDLEIGLHRRDAEHYTVELRLQLPETEGDVRSERSGLPLAQFNVAALRARALDPDAYGRALTDGLFGDPRMTVALADARRQAGALDRPLRVRLFVGPSAPELHELGWELLRDPSADRPLLMTEQILFSRYLSSLDWRPVQLRSRGALRALIVVANPDNLADYGFAPLDAPGEVARAEQSLGDMRRTTLAAAGTATLPEVLRRLRDDQDILYLVCHGGLAKTAAAGGGERGREREAALWLEDEAGRAAIVPASEVVERLSGLRRRPRLIVLAACRSAGAGLEVWPGERGVLAALGPRLVEAGVPAVLAMQGDVSTATVEQFMPTFFRELAQHGEVDRAATVARERVRDRPDHWMPALFMRLKSGRIWYESGFARDGREFEKWPALLRFLGGPRGARLTPILGPGLIEHLVGAPNEIAWRWAERHRYPLAPHTRDALPQVAQYLSVTQYTRFPHESLEEEYRQSLVAIHAGALPEAATAAPLAELVEVIWAQQRADASALPEPHRLLAALELPIYLTANTDDLLARALRAAGKAPREVVCPWNEHLERQVQDGESGPPEEQPTPERPLVYYLFGQLHDPESIVLTEDDYFTYLIGVTRNKKLIPEAVRRALTDRALLFLGFRMDSWDFRACFHSLINPEGERRRSDFPHVAVQIEPDEGHFLEPERARRYLEAYYLRGADINLYWGSVADFAGELAAQVQRQSAGAATRAMGG